MPFASDVKDSFFLDAGLSYDDPKTITGATAANPVVITAVAHGFANGDEVDITGIVWEPTIDDYGTRTQPDQLNGTRYTVANKATDTFELNDSLGAAIDGSAFNAYAKGGEVRKAVNTVSGLWHLEGEEVVVLADGEEITGKTVSTGAISLTDKASRIHVGLPYYAEVETLNVETTGGGTIQDQKKKINSVVVRVEKSRGMIIGGDTDKLVPVRDADFTGEDSENGLLTGDIDVTLKPDWKSNGRFIVRQRGPFPLTILTLIPNMTLEGSDE